MGERSLRSVVVVVVLGGTVVVDTEVVTVVELVEVVVSALSSGEQAVRISPSANNPVIVARIGGDGIEPGELDREDAAGDGQLGKGLLRLVHGYRELDAFGVRLENVHGVDVHSRVCNDPGQAG